MTTGPGFKSESQGILEMGPGTRREERPEVTLLNLSLKIISLGKTHLWRAHYLKLFDLPFLFLAAGFQRAFNWEREELCTQSQRRPDGFVRSRDPPPGLQLIGFVVSSFQVISGPLLMTFLIRSTRQSPPNSIQTFFLQFLVGMHAAIQDTSKFKVVQVPGHSTSCWVLTEENA